MRGLRRNAFRDHSGGSSPSDRAGRAIFPRSIVEMWGGSRVAD